MSVYCTNSWASKYSSSFYVPCPVDDDQISRAIENVVKWYINFVLFGALVLLLKYWFIEVELRILKIIL